MEDLPVAERVLQIGNSIKNVIKYWEGLSKPKRPSNKSCEALVKYHRDVLVSCKLQFFAFIASISHSKPFLQIFQIDRPMLPFLLNELESLTNQVVRVEMIRDAIKEADTIRKKLREKWVKDVNNQLEKDWVYLGATTKDLTKAQISVEKKRKFKNVSRW